MPLAGAELAAAAELLRIAREGATYPKRPKFILGPRRGWLARAEAEYQRAACPTTTRWPGRRSWTRSVPPTSTR